MICRNLFIGYILLFINICIIYTENINAILYTFDPTDSSENYHSKLRDGFNEYSRINNLNIQLELKTLTPKNSTTLIKDYGTVIESYIFKHSTKYDLIFFYSAYTKKYAEHFENLKNYLKEETINSIDESILKNTCTSKDGELVSVPIFLSISALFSNTELLTKYQKEIPKTWNELMDTSKYIYDEERKLGKNIIRYNGAFDDDNGSISLYEFINSYRESNEKPHPKIIETETIEALEKIKEMKDEIGEEIFRGSDMMTINSLFSGNALFVRYFYCPYNNIIYTATALPGRNKNVSGSIVVPNNFAINKYISEEKKKAAATFLDYALSKDVQKNAIIENRLYSGIMDLYNDQDVCNKIDCAVVNGARPFSFIGDEFADDRYHDIYRENMFDFIFKNKSIAEALKTIDEYTPSFGVNRRNIGSISFILSVTVMFCWLLF